MVTNDTARSPILNNRKMIELIALTLCLVSASVATNESCDRQPDVVISNENYNVFKENKSCELSHIYSCRQFETTGLFNASDAVYKTDGIIDKPTVNVVDLWNSFPKVILPTNSTSGKCRADVEMLLEGVRNMELWALKMIDSTAKLPSGILSGNINQYGDFDECLSLQDVIQGKYCLASFQISLKNEPYHLPELDKLINAHYVIRSNMTDPGHRIPRFSSILWGVCMPKSCSAYDLEKELLDILKGLGAEVLVEESNCVTTENKVEETLGKQITRSTFLTILTLLVIGTFYYSENIPDDRLNMFEKIIRAFSIPRNYSKMISTSSKDELRGVDGARALNALALVIAHKSMALYYNPYINRTSMGEIYGKPWSVIGRTSILYTDTFLLISGLLNARGLLQDLATHGKMNFWKRLRSRVFRLLPLLAAVILFCTYILPDLGSGPQWRLVIEEHSRLCKSNMWRNFLFIHNLYGFPPMCLTHTHQIGIDMQLFLATPLFVWLLWNRPRFGIMATLAVGAISTALRYWIVIDRQISMVVYFGISVEQLFNAASLSYTLPTHRATVYLIGVILAYIMTKRKSYVQFSKLSTSIFWTIAFGLGFLAQLGPWRMALKDFNYEPISAAIFAAFSPIIWGMFLSWGIWASVHHHAGWFGDFLSWKGFKIFSKMAYAFYLVQFPVFFYNVGVLRSPGLYKPQNMLDMSELGTIMLISLASTVCVEMPFTEIHNILFNQRTKNTLSSNDTIKKNELPDVNGIIHHKKPEKMTDLLTN